MPSDNDNIALVCGLNSQVGCQDRLHVNSDAAEALASRDIRSECVRF